MTAGARDFIVEVGTEELPPKALPELERAFAEGVRTGLASAGLPFAALASFAAPRRLAVLVSGLAASQPAQQLRKRGPPVSAAFDAAGQPTRAALAFAQGCGVDVASLTRAIEGKGEFLFFETARAGSATSTLLPGIVQAALDALPIPKRMRWGSGTAEFVRPVHWLLMKFGGDVVPATILGVEAGSTTRGHRFHAPQPIEVPEPARYAALLREQGYVLADFAERRARIVEQVAACAAQLGGTPVMDAASGPALLDEVTALVEWPVAIAGRFEARFLELPREVLISTLQEHQRYFAVQTADGRLLDAFITVANIESRAPARVREGNERVVRPRLADAAFFWQQDRKQPLAASLPGLDVVTFQAKLGSIGDKTRRVRALAVGLAAELGADTALVGRAADLAKCDLLSKMVGEFPELQGVMGAYYALADGESAEVAAAIREHYQPRAAGGELPHSVTGVVLAIADKVDTLAGIFAIGQKPTGTRDPFGLRRAAIGVLRILRDRKLGLDLRALVARAVAAQPVAAQPVVDSSSSSGAASGEVLDFLLERLRALLAEEGVGNERFDAVLAAVLASGGVSPPDIDARLQALGGFMQRPEAASLAAANKRIANILKKSAPAAGPAAAGATAAGITAAGTASAGAAAGAVNPALLGPGAESNLHAALAALRPGVEAALARRDYAGALASLATLRPAIDAFFDGVMVNDPDAKLRDNRLALVGQVRALFGGVADLSRLPG
jgi:glycyl-tRNA synthetase beta chain